MKCTPENEAKLERYFYTTDEQGSTTLITNTTAIELDKSTVGIELLKKINIDYPKIEIIY